MLPDLLIRNLGLLLQGAERTLELSLATALFSSAIGVTAALFRTFGRWPFRFAVDAYVYLVRGVPLLLLLFFMYYGLPYSGIHIAPVPGGILVMSIYFGAFMAEVFRAAIEALPRAQWDAARSLGMRPASDPRHRRTAAGASPLGAAVYQHLRAADQEHVARFHHRPFGADDGRTPDRGAHLRTVSDPAGCGGHLLRDLLFAFAGRQIRREVGASCRLTAPPRHRWSSFAA